MLLLGSPVLAATLTVGTDGYATIGEAEAAASSGDTIEIASGTWAEDLRPAGKDLTYAGTSGTTITGSTGNPCYDAYSGEAVTLQDLTFQGCSRAVQIGGDGSITVTDVAFTSNGSASVGAALYATNSAAVTIEGSTFTDNTATNGGAIYADGTVTLEITSSDFAGGTASSTGGEVRTGGSVTTTISSTTFSDAQASDGGCLYLTGTGTVTLTDVELDGCTASSQGGAIYLSSASSASFSGLDVANATAAYGAGLATWTDVTIDDFLFSTNTVSSYGGHVYAPSTDLTLSDGTFEHGEAYQGGAIYQYTAALTAQDVVFDTHTASDRGGAVYSSTLEITFTDVDMLDNAAGHRGGAIYSLGGHVSELDLVGGSFTGNSSADNGGAFYLNDLEPTSIAGAYFEGNSAVDGGALYIHGNYGAYGPSYVDASWFVDNTASQSGGGFYVQYTADTYVSSSAFLQNTAGSAGGGFYSGAGDFETSSFVTGSAFLENTSGTYGGGVFSNTSNLEVDHVSFACNSSGLAGGVYTTSSSTLSNNVVQGSTGGGIYVSSPAAAPDNHVLYDNDSFEWSPTDYTGSDGNVEADPGFTALSCDGDWTTEELTPAEGSILIDATSGTDADGSTADLGGYGGEDGAYLDVDADGYTPWDGDCDESDPDVNPGATEVWYDGVDQDCDEADDSDADEDGWGVEDDCDEDDPDIHPGATETWYDGVDQDCAEDDDDDADGDGYGLDDDCDDTDSAIHPGATEVWYDGVDDDCDGNDDDQDEDGTGVEEDCDDTDATLGGATAWYADADGDGYGTTAYTATSCDQPSGYVADATDCDDTDADLSPDTVWYADGDGDGYGDASITDVACEQPYGTVDNGDDCDDASASLNPDTVWYADADGDGYGSASYTTTSCEQPSGYLADATDCDDTEATSYPGADETCDEADDDCDGTIDEDADDPSTWYADVDGDGYGDAGSTTDACEVPSGHVDNADDCDDLDATVAPDRTFYVDADDDGYGHADYAYEACIAPSGTVQDATDCDDGDASVHPDAEEACNGLDDDCDGDTDESFDELIWYADADGDGYGDPTVAAVDCVAPTGYVDDPSDCDDASATTHPGADETCNEVDDDCDDDVDEDAVDAETWYEDRDGDGWGADGTGELTCHEPDDASTTPGDCDDADADAYPGAPGWDEDCNPLASDTGEPPEGDTSVHADTGGDELPKDECGCASGGAAWALWPLSLLALRRRR